MAEQKVFARWGDFSYAGQTLDRGQIIELTGQQNDEKLLRLGYMQKLTKAQERIQVQCGECGQWFIDDQVRNAHGKARHRTRGEDLEVGAAYSITAPGELMGGGKGAEYVGMDVMEDRSGERQERRNMQEAPLYLEKTKASQRG